MGILGPLEVDGTVPRSRVARAVLSWTVLHAGRRVRFDSCARALFPDDPIAASTRRVRDAARELARHHPEVVGVEGTTLRLLATHELVDEQVFRRLVTGRGAGAGDPDERDRLGRALKLWRGRAYPDLSGISTAESAAAELNELRLVATERRFALDVVATVDYQLVAELHAAVERHPQRERLWRQLAVALFASSRQTEALRQLEQGRQALTRHGGHSSPELEALYLAILRGDVDSAQAAA